MELIAKLGIDWKLLLAQIVNFTILVGVLTYFVYRPLLDLLDQRREKIRKSMEDAKMIENQKKEMELFRTEQLRKIDQEVGAFLERAKQQAEKSKEDILASARKESDQIVTKGTKQVEDERATALKELQASLAPLILTMTQKILEREFSPEDQKRLLTTLEKEIPAAVR